MRGLQPASFVYSFPPSHSVGYKLFNLSHLTGATVLVCHITKVYLLEANRKLFSFFFLLVLGIEPRTS